MIGGGTLSLVESILPLPVRFLYRLPPGTVLRIDFRRQLPDQAAAEIDRLALAVNAERLPEVGNAPVVLVPRQSVDLMVCRRKDGAETGKRRSFWFFIPEEDRVLATN